jgi:serine/threonine-protein kinase HipA
MYRPVDVVEIRAWGHLVGAVTLDPALGYYAFEYDRRWQRRGIELAPLTMPVAKAVHVFPLLPELTYRRLPAMLADALPDDFGNALIDAYLAREGVAKEQISALDRLAYMGGRAMGAMEFKPARGPRQKTTAIEIGSLVESTRLALNGNFKGDRETEAAIMNLLLVGTSAGGAKAKAVIAWNPETGAIRSGQLPADPGFDYWLIKLDGVTPEQQLAGSLGEGRLEYAYYLMATAAGISMSECRLLEENGRAHFLTRRFDRQNGEKQHIQTLCAINHIDYKQLGTYDYNQFLQTITALGLPPEDLAQGYRRMVFNVMAANCDDHSKNHSFLLGEHGKWHLAPAYDLTHAFNPHGKWTFQHFHSVNGRFAGIRVSDLEAVGDRFMVPGYRQIIKDVKGAVAQWPEFAKKAGLNESQWKRVQNDLRHAMT